MLQFLISLTTFVVFLIDIVTFAGLRMIILYTLVLTVSMFKGSIATHLPKISYLTLGVRMRLQRIIPVMLIRTGHARTRTRTRTKPTKTRTRTRTSLTVTYCKLQLNLQSLSSNNNESSQHMTVKPITLNK